MGSREDEVLFLEDDLDAEYRIYHPEEPVKHRVQRCAKWYFCCAPWEYLLRIIPIVKWLPAYPVKTQLVKDLAAGCTVGIVNLPQGMAYALLASVPAVYGLYTSFFPVLMFAIFSSSKHVSIGTFAIISMMVGDIVDQKVPACPTTASTIPQSTTVAAHTTGFTLQSSESTCEDEYESRKVEIAIAIAMAVGLLQILMRVLQLGIIRVYLSDYLIAAFTCGAAFHVLTSQIPKLFGISVPRYSGAFALIYTWIDIFRKLPTTNVWDLLIATLSIIFLIVGKEINQRYKKQLPFPIPWELFVIILTTIWSYYGELYEKYGVVIVGDIPTGIQVFVPAPPDVIDVMGGSVAIAIVAFAIEISLAQIFAMQHSYDVDANQECFALGVSNIFGSFFGCFVCASSLSRSAIWDDVGGKTQIVGLTSAIIILTVLLWIGPLFESLPQAALGAIIVVNLKRLLFQLNQIPPLWRRNKLDAVTFVAVFTLVILFGVATGLGLGVAFELIIVVIKIQMASGKQLGRLSRARTYKQTKHYKCDLDENDSTLLFCFTGPLCFANKERFLLSLSDAVGYDPIKRALSPKIVMINKAGSIENIEFENELQEDTKYGVENEAYLPNNIVTMRRQKELSEDTSNSSDPDTSSTCSTSLGVSEPSTTLKNIIFDMSVIMFLDDDAAKLIAQLFSSFRTLNIDFIVAACNVPNREAIINHCKESRPAFFVSLDGAVDYTSGKLNLELDNGGRVLKDETEENNDNIDNENNQESATIVINKRHNVIDDGGTTTL